MAVPSVVAVALVVSEPPLEVAVVETVWSPVLVEPPAPVVSLPVLVALSVPALVLLTVVPAVVPPLVAVALPVVEPIVPEPVVLASELERLLVESGCEVEVEADSEPEPHAATKNAKKATVIDNDALYIPRRLFERMGPDALRRRREKR